jgi:chaperonin GroEL
VREIVAGLRRQACPVTTEDQLAYLANLMVQDPSLAAVLGEMSYLLGPDAHVIIENYEAPYLQRQYIAGTHYAAQIASPHFYTDVAQKSATVTDAAIVLTDSTIDDADQVVELMQAAVDAGRSSLFIVAPSISDTALGVLIANHRSKDVPLTIASAKLREAGDDRHAAYQDLALLTGARLLGNAHARTIQAIQAADLGFARRVQVTENRLIIVSNSYKNPAVQTETLKLRQRLADPTLNREQRPYLIKRLAALTGGIGELKIGALSKYERKLRHDQAERALKVLSLAQRGGVVTGAGAALIHCTEQLTAWSSSNTLAADADLGVQVMCRALQAPLRQILNNAHVPDAALIISDVAASGAPVTYDVRTEEIGSGMEMAVLDPVEVVIAAVTKAASAAMMALSTETIVYHRHPIVEGTNP